MDTFLAVHPKTEPQSRASSIFDRPPISRSQTVHTRPILTNTEIIAPAVDKSSYIVISGGSGANTICSAFPAATTYILPVSDDGGSSSEIIRVIGGPSLGDIRSRLTRLIVSNPSMPHVEPIRALLSHRLSSSCSNEEARILWREIVEGRSELWSGIPSDRKELIRGFLVHFEGEVLKRAHKNFSFRNGSIGNFFLAGAQLFFRSLPSAILLFSSITGSQGNILPVLVTNHTVTIAAALESGRTIIGQCEISHPVLMQGSISGGNISDSFLDGLEDDDGPPSSTRVQNVEFQKINLDEEEILLDSSIERVFYINAYGQEIYPTPNPDFLANLAQRGVLVYSCGSLWTSIIPCLALKGIASSIAKSSTLRVKLLLLNWKNDRETMGYTAIDYVLQITKTLNRHNLTPRATGYSSSEYPVSAFVTHLAYVDNCQVHVDHRKLANFGVRAIKVYSDGEGFNASSMKRILDQINENEDYNDRS